MILSNPRDCTLSLLVSTSFAESSFVSMSNSTEKDFLVCMRVLKVSQRDY